MLLKEITQYILRKTDGIINKTDIGSEYFEGSYENIREIVRKCTKPFIFCDT